MKQWTWGEMRAKIQRDLDLEDEGFITQDELLGYANQAIDEAEQEFRKLLESYFDDEEPLALVSGQSEYDLPENIWANKIRFIQYSNGTNKYPIERIKELKDIVYITNQNYHYRYRIINKASTGIKIKLYPTPQETSADSVMIYFERNAAEIVDDESILDMPEAAQFIIQHIKDSCANKEKGPMFVAPESPQLQNQRRLLIESLTDLTSDTDNKINPDMEFYYDFDNQENF